MSFANPHQQCFGCTCCFDSVTNNVIAGNNYAITTSDLRMGIVSVTTASSTDKVTLPTSIALVQGLGLNVGDCIDLEFRICQTNLTDILTLTVATGITLNFGSAIICPAKTTSGAPAMYFFKTRLRVNAIAYDTSNTISSCTIVCY